MSTLKHILVLDDNIDVAQGVADILDLCGYRVTMSHDGPSAIEAFDQGGIDLGIFDIRMPGMNGVEAFLEVRRRHPDARVLMMSGYADEGLIDRALDNGALELLPKPFEPDALIQHVSELKAA